MPGEAGQSAGGGLVSCHACGRRTDCYPHVPTVWIGRRARSGSGAPPVATVIGSFAITWDNSAQLINQTTGITQNSLNITLGSNRGEYQQIAVHPDQ